ncbi:uncharacterized protein LOC144872225 [Branchiostoma floridae x Branchiostoma japonicum]
MDTKVSSLRENVWNPPTHEMGRITLEERKDVQNSQSHQTVPQPAKKEGGRKIKRVFISYSMDPYNNSARSPQQHKEDINLQRSRVRSLADALRLNGVDCRIDQNWTWVTVTTKPG